MSRLHIAIICPGSLPVPAYGGTERVAWGLARELVRAGHRVTLLTSGNSQADFAHCIRYNPGTSLEAQVPADVDFIHLHAPFRTQTIRRPHMYTIQGNAKPGETYSQNTVFVSRNHARRHGSEAYVLNGLYWPDYGQVDWTTPRKHLLFLAKASRSEKNLRGSRKAARKAGLPLAVLGGSGWDIRGNTRYYGMVGGEKKNRLLNQGLALLFPILWEEPFGLAVIEALYFGCPVIATPRGAMPELVTPEVGILSENPDDWAQAAAQSGSYDRKALHEYVREEFSASRVAADYLRYYERVLNGEVLNPKAPGRPMD
nr:hypothetical protein [uncultured bacterium]